MEGQISITTLTHCILLASYRYIADKLVYCYHRRLCCYILLITQYMLHVSISSCCHFKKPGIHYPHASTLLLQWSPGSTISLWPHNQDFVRVIKHIVVSGYATAADDY